MVLFCLFLCQSFVPPYICAYYLCSVWVADGPPFEKELPTRLTICSLCNLTIFNFSYFPFFGFKGGIWALIAPVSGHCYFL